jgi:Flp pilus assembly pilin Flp
MQTLANALLDDRGQDLTEYVLLATLISLAVVVSVKSYATAIGTAFTAIGTKFRTYTS